MGRARSPVAARAPRNVKANHAVNFINSLTHVKGEWAGKPFNLRPWQESLVRTIFGTLTAEGIRQYRTVYVEIPRKNGKTAIGAAIALYMLLGDGEKGAEVYSAAVDLEQAGLAYSAATQMLRGEPELMADVDIIDSKKRIVYYPTASFYRAIPSDAASAHGYNASAIIADELHAWRGRDLWDVLTTSMGARRQPLTVVITTAGYDRASICWELHAYAVNVRDGAVIDPTFLPVLYGAPDDADWLDEKVWREANPALGDFRSLDEMRVSAQQAREVPARQNTFRRLYLCQWTESETRWLDMEAWDEGGASVDPVALNGRRCYAGLDLSTTKDLSALVLVFPDDLGGYDVVPYFWCPSDGIVKRARKDRAPYDTWSRLGFLRATTGQTVDYDEIRETIRDLTRRYRVERISYDRWNATQLVTQLQEDGAPMVEMGQGFASMAAPSKDLERLVNARALRHGGHPVLRWCVANTVTEQDAAGNLKPSKKKSTERIDGTVALVMALDGAMRSPVPLERVSSWV